MPKDPHSDSIQINISACRGDPSIFSIADLGNWQHPQGPGFHLLGFSPFGTGQGLTSPSHTGEQLLRALWHKFPWKKQFRGAKFLDSVKKPEFQWPLIFISWKAAWIHLVKVNSQGKRRFLNSISLSPSLGGFYRCTDQSHTKPPKICWAGVLGFLITFIFPGKLSTKVAPEAASRNWHLWLLRCLPWCHKFWR